MPIHGKTLYEIGLSARLCGKMMPHFLSSSGESIPKGEVNSTHVKDERVANIL